MQLNTINWDELRTSFFNECTDKSFGLSKVTLAPHDLFEWFKKEVMEFVKPTFHQPSEKPIPAPDDPANSVDVFIMDEDGMHGLAFYSFEYEEWWMNADDFDGFEDGQSKWVWYYPPYTTEDVVSNQ